MKILASINGRVDVKPIYGITTEEEKVNPEKGHRGYFHDLHACVISISLLLL